MGHLWFHTNKVLWAGVYVIVDSILHSGLSSNLRSTDAGASVVVSKDRVVKKDRVLVEVILRLRLGHSGGL